MEKLLLIILLFFHISSSEKHSLKFFSVGSSGIPNLPHFVVTVEVDQVQAAYCDSNKMIKAKQHWVEYILWTDEEQVEWYSAECFDSQPHFFKDTLNSLKQDLNQAEGVHVLQSISGCEWDDETGEVDGFLKFGYDGEDILSFDVKSLTWIALKPEAESLRLKWDADKTRKRHYRNYIINVCPPWLKKYVVAAKTSLIRTVLPSVSLLQKSPSSPITCFATGFYPNRAKMFWRKDGEELFEDVEYGEILPNHDGSFQMSVDLNISNISSVTPEDLGRFECVFQFSGVNDTIIIRLDKAPLRTNWGKSTVSKIEDHGGSPVSVVLGVVICLIVLVLVAAVAGFMFYRQRKSKRKTAKTKTEGPETEPETTPMNSPSCKQQHQDNEE